MEWLSKGLVGLVALIQLAIMAVEMLLWPQPAVHSRLGFDQAQAEQVYPIVKNAGLYNGFLAAGLIWGLLGATDSRAVQTFFLICVIVAGVFGAVTLKPTTLLLQTLPAAVALAAVWWAKRPPAI